MRRTGIDITRLPARETRCARVRVYCGAALVLLLFCTGICSAGTSGNQKGSSRSDATQRNEASSSAATVTVKKDIDVGTFYMHKGDYGAAISRFQEAVHLDAQDQKARLLLAESYEKQGNRSEAIQTYEDFLHEFPHARDRDKILKKVDELTHKRD